MSILDEIVNNAEARRAPRVEPPPTVNLAHSFRTGDAITESGARHVASKIAAHAYRGVGIDISDCQNEPKCILEKGKLDWKTVPMPLAIQGKTEVRPYPGMIALVRSDNGTPLGVATDSYKPHQNQQLVEVMSRFADHSGLTLSRIGTFDGGARGFCVAVSEVSREAKVGDVVAMRIILKFGHTPGTATTFQVWAEELRCSNGATIGVAGGDARFVHMAELTPERIAKAAAFVTEASKAFNAHVDELTHLREVPSNKALDRWQVIQLFNEELAGNVAEKLGGSKDLKVSGQKVIAQLLESEASQEYVELMVRRSNSRLLSQIMDALDSQPGGSMTAGTMAHAYSGVTHYNSNVRGRSADTGLEANLWGGSQADSQAAFILASSTARMVEMVN